MKPLTFIRSALLAAGLIFIPYTAFPVKGDDLMKKVPSALSTNLIEIKTKHIEPGSRPLIVVLGENHVSIKNQQQVADLLSSLASAAPLGAILLEGTNGPVDVQKFRTDLANTVKSTDKYRPLLRQYLNWGKISGADYAILTLAPSPDGYGVEDLAARARNEIALEGMGLRNHVKIFQNGAALLRTTLAGKALAGDKQGVDNVMALVAKLDTATQKYSAACDDYITKDDASAAGKGEIAEIESKRAAIFNRLDDAKPSLEEYNKWIEQYNKLVHNHSFNLELTNVDQQIQDYESKNAHDLSEIHNLIARANLVNDTLPPIQNEIKKANAAYDDAENCYFVAANAAALLCDKHSVSSALLRSFFGDEAARLEKEQMRGANVDLTERNQAMVENTITYLNANPQTHLAVLIVGDAHLAGITDLLTANKISFIAGKMQAADEPNEPWEQSAYDSQFDVKDDVFRQNKPPTQLQNPWWKADRLAETVTFKHIDSGVFPPTISSLSSGNAYFSNFNRANRDLEIIKSPEDRNANFGGYVIDRGPVADHTNWSYTVLDNKAGVTEAQKESDTKTLFAYSYVTTAADTKKPVYCIKSTAGTQSTAEFAGALPPPGVERVVLINSDARQRLALSLGNGGGGKPPRPPPATPHGADSPNDDGTDPTGKDEPPTPPGGADSGSDDDWWTSTALSPRNDGKSPQLFYTINAHRAKDHLDALDRQNPAAYGNVSFYHDNAVPGHPNSRPVIEFPTQLPFTPHTGENSQMVLIVGKNTEDMRQKIKIAGENKQLVGKQVALIMCGDTQGVTDQLRESILDKGGLMVWAPDRKITPAAAGKLRGYIMADLPTLKPEERGNIGLLIRHALRSWSKANPNDGDLKSFRGASTFVLDDAKSKMADAA